jgi:hypothetical protein
MIFLKHVRHKLVSRDELRCIVDRVHNTASRVRGVRMRDVFVLTDRDEFVLVMESPDLAAYHQWRDLCPPPPGATDWVESATLPGEFERDAV